MKKIFTILPVLFMTFMTLTMTSCEDAEIAYTLEGCWRGDMRIRSTHRGADYYSTSTEIYFDRDHSRYSSGTGYWVDFYSDAPWDYVANHIDWTVDDGVIKIYFREDGNTFYIRDYSLNDDHFRGTLYDAGQHVEFSLYHVSSPNWGRYERWGYDGWYDSYYYDDYYYDGYWSRTTRGADTDSTATDRPVRSIY